MVLKERYNYFSIFTSMTNQQILRVSLTSFIADTNVIILFLQANLKKIPNRPVIKTGAIKYQDYLDLYEAIQQCAAQLQANPSNNAIKKAIAQLPTLTHLDIIVHPNKMLDALHYLIYPWGVLAYYQKAKVLIEKLTIIKETLMSID